MHRKNKQWKMKRDQNLLSLKYQRSLPVVLAGSKTGGRDRIVPNCRQTRTLLGFSTRAAAHPSPGRMCPRGAPCGRGRAGRAGVHGAAHPSRNPGWGHSEPHPGGRTGRHCCATGCDLLGPLGGKNIHEQAIFAFAVPISMSCFAG